MWNIVNFLAGGITSLFFKIKKKEKKAKEQLDTLPIAGLDGIAVPDTSGTFFKYPTHPDLKIENDWVPGN